MKRETQNLELASDEVRLLTEIAVVAIGRRDPDRARQLFAALCELRPDVDFPYIGLALALMSGGRAADAVKLLEEADRRFPNNAAIQTHLGMALLLNDRRTHSTAMLNRVVRRRNIGQQDKRLARALLLQPIPSYSTH